MYKKIIHLFLFFLIAAISLSPRFSFGVLSGGRNIDIRVEDVIIFIGVIVCFLYVLIFKKYKLKLPPLFWPVLSICSFGFFSVLINLLLGNIVSKIAFFYFLKEIEFFILYFLVFFSINDLRASQPLIKYWLFFSLVNIFWIFYVFIFNISWSISYGPDAFIEQQGPFPSGGFFLMLFIFSFNLFIFYYSKSQLSITKKIFIFIYCLLPIFGIIMSGSMASTLGLFCSICISMFIFFGDKINFIRIIKSLILAMVCCGFLFAIIYILPVTKRIVSFDKIIWEYTSSSSQSRISILKDHLSKTLISPSNLIIGLGVKGEAHSQYVRVLTERGIIGMFLFLWLMLSILRISFKEFKVKKDNFGKGIAGGLLTATVVMLIMSIPNDSFMVVKIAEIYWFFTAISMFEIFKSDDILKV